MKTGDLKKVVKEKYGNIATQSNLLNQSGCCGDSSCCGEFEYADFSDDYTYMPGYQPDADLGLGCGSPTNTAAIKNGDSVLDLGSGAGNDCFVAHSFIGENGKITGLDFTEAMVKKARENLKKTKYNNIEFVLGDIENMPFPENQFDVVISNCVLNLVPDKVKAFSEIYRVLKTKGHFCVSDVVLTGELPEKLQLAAELYVGCISGAMQKEEYLEIIKQQGFSNITIHKETHSIIPDNLLKKYLQELEIKEFKKRNLGIISITVSATK